MEMEMIRLTLNEGNFVEFRGKMLFSYRETAESTLTLYRAAEGEIGEYALYVETLEGNAFYCFGEDKNDGLRLLPKLDSIPTQKEV